MLIGGFGFLDAFLFVEVAREPAGRPYLGFLEYATSISSRPNGCSGSLDSDLDGDDETSLWLRERGYNMNFRIDFNAVGKSVELCWPLLLTARGSWAERGIKLGEVY
jgi:hypothetical protein